MNDYRLLIPKNMLFLVTGGAGFIGSNIVEKLMFMGYKVRVLDNFSTGSEENIMKFMDNPNFHLISGDIRDYNVCYRACKGVDYILHQGALGSVPRSINDPKSTNEVNITGTLNMLMAAKDNKIKRFVYASSSSVYGDNLDSLKVEDKIGNPLSPYAITKLTAELYAKNFYHLYKVPTIGLRYFNVFGKRQNPKSKYAAVIPIFIDKILSQESPIIYGDGKQSRDFTYIDNVVDANLKACEAGEEAFGKVFNIACGKRSYLIDIYNEICTILDEDIQPIFAPPRKGDVKHSLADIKKAKEILNYYPKTYIKEGLKETIEWYKIDSKKKTR